jgi:hypothetical protein
MWHRLRKRGHGGIARTRAVDHRGQCAWRDERKWREEANVPFHLAFTLCDLGERSNAARNEVVDPGSRLGYGEENGRGIKDLREPDSLAGRVRRKGAGRPVITTKDPTLLDDLRQLLEPATMGDPMRPLRWVSKSHEKLATALREMGHKVSASSIPKLLGQLGYRRHVNRKTKDGSNHPGDTNSTVIDLFSGRSSNWRCLSARASTVSLRVIPAGARSRVDPVYRCRVDPPARGLR